MIEQAIEIKIGVGRMELNKDDTKSKRSTWIVAMKG